MELGDIKGKVKLADGEIHSVEVDPKAQLVERQGLSGPYWVITVQEDGEAREISMGSNLAQRIRELKLKEPTLINIQRTGSSFSTDYEVSKAE